MDVPRSRRYRRSEDMVQTFRGHGTDVPRTWYRRSEDMVQTIHSWLRGDSQKPAMEFLGIFRFVKHPSRNDLVEAYAMNRTFEGSQSKGGGGGESQ